MFRFETTTGCKRLPITIEYSVVNGLFTKFFVLIYEPEGPINISGYLSTTEIDLLQYEAQMHYRDLKMGQVYRAELCEA